MDDGGRGGGGSPGRRITPRLLRRRRRPSLYRARTASGYYILPSMLYAARYEYSSAPRHRNPVLMGRDNARPPVRKAARPPPPSVCTFVILFVRCRRIENDFFFFFLSGVGAGSKFSYRVRNANVCALVLLGTRELRIERVTLPGRHSISIIYFIQI